MQNNIQIIPAILAFSEEEYKKKVDIINSAPEFVSGFVQIDITDGEFTESKSVGIDILAKYPLNINTEVHLMVLKPLDWVDNLYKLGVKRIVVAVESEQVEESLSKIHGLGLEVGLGINPQTPVGKVMPFIDKTDTLLILSVYPGLGGQTFIPETLDKIKQADKLKNEYGFKLEVDGGITLENIKDVVEAGVDGIVIGEHLIYGDIEKNLEDIWEKLHS